MMSCLGGQRSGSDPVSAQTLTDPLGRASPYLQPESLNQKNRSSMLHCIQWGADDTMLQTDETHGRCYYRSHAFPRIQSTTLGSIMMS